MRPLLQLWMPPLQLWMGPRLSQLKCHVISSHVTLLKKALQQRLKVRSSPALDSLQHAHGWTISTQPICQVDLHLSAQCILSSGAQLWRSLACMVFEQDLCDCICCMRNHSSSSLLPLPFFPCDPQLFPPSSLLLHAPLADSD